MLNKLARCTRKFCKIHKKIFFLKKLFDSFTRNSEVCNFVGDNTRYIIWVKVFKNRPSKICGRQPLKDLKRFGLLADHITSNFLKAVFHKFYLAHS